MAIERVATKQAILKLNQLNEPSHWATAQTEKRLS